MSDTSLSSYVRIARQSEDFPVKLGRLRAALKGLIPDEVHFSEDSYDEIFAVLAAAFYYLKDKQLRHVSANKSGSVPKLIQIMTDEGKRDKDAELVEEVLERVAPYVPPKVFLETLRTMHLNKTHIFAEYHGAIERIMADLYRIVTGFEVPEECPKALVRWASGAAREIIYQEFFP